MPAARSVGTGALRGPVRAAHEVMRSSAMRDIMSLVEREEVISLGRPPDTSRPSPSSYAAV